LFDFRRVLFRFVFFFFLYVINRTGFLKETKFQA